MSYHGLKYGYIYASGYHLKILRKLQTSKRFHPDIPHQSESYPATELCHRRRYSEIYIDTRDSAWFDRSVNLLSVI